MKVSQLPVPVLLQVPESRFSTAATTGFALSGEGFEIDCIENKWSTADRELK
jgi:hypothetical protein